MMFLLGIYLAGLAVALWRWIQLGVFLAYDERPAWLAILEAVLWPIAAPIRLFMLIARATG